MNDASPEPLDARHDARAEALARVPAQRRVMEELAGEVRRQGAELAELRARCDAQGEEIRMLAEIAQANAGLTAEMTRAILTLKGAAHVAGDASDRPGS